MLSVVCVCELGCVRICSAHALIQVCDTVVVKMWTNLCVDH